MTRPIENIGVGSLHGTFQIDTTGGTPDLDSTNEGNAVALSGNNETDRGSDGDALLGQLASAQDDIAVVQFRGVIRVPYDNTAAPTLGGQVAVNGTGKVKASATGRGMVIAVNSGDETVDVLL